MKRKLVILLLPVMLFTFGCEKNGESKITCRIDRNDTTNGYSLKSVYEINSKNDLVEYVESEEVVTSDSSAMLDYFEKTLKETYESANSTYGGYTYNVQRTSNTVTSKVKVDYSVMNVTRYVEEQQVLKSYLKDGKLKTTGVKSLYEVLGAECK